MKRYVLLLAVAVCGSCASSETSDVRDSVERLLRYAPRQFESVMLMKVPSEDDGSQVPASVAEWAFFNAARVTDNRCARVACFGSDFKAPDGIGVGDWKGIVVSEFVQGVSPEDVLNAQGAEVVRDVGGVKVFVQTGGVPSTAIVEGNLVLQGDVDLLEEALLGPGLSVAKVKALCGLSEKPVDVLSPVTIFRRYVANDDDHYSPLNTTVPKIAPSVRGFPIRGMAIEWRRFTPIEFRLHVASTDPDKSLEFFLDFIGYTEDERSYVSIGERRSQHGYWALDGTWRADPEMVRFLMLLLFGINIFI